MAAVVTLSRPVDWLKHLLRWAKFNVIGFQVAAGEGQEPSKQAVTDGELPAYVDCQTNIMRLTKQVAQIVQEMVSLCQYSHSSMSIHPNIHLSICWWYSWRCCFFTVCTLSNSMQNYSNSICSSCHLLLIKMAKTHLQTVFSVWNTILKLT